MLEVQIICISKDNGDHYDPHEAISHYHWLGDPKTSAGWIYTRQAMVDFLEKGNKAFVTDGTSKAYCQVRSNGHIKFLQTVSNGKFTDNLLQLPECKHRTN